MVIAAMSCMARGHPSHSKRVAMKTPTIAVNARRQRGVALPVIIAIVLILIGLGIAAWFLIIRPQHAATAALQPATSAIPATAATRMPPPANVAAMTTDQLLSEARKALAEQRLLAPAGNNAFEFYLKVLERQPNNKVAQDALRETFPIGANAAEQAINQNQFDEAQREIDLLAKSDPDNYTLTILRSKLDAQRKLSVRQQQLEAQQQLAQQQAAETAKKQAAAQQAAAQQKAAQEAEAARLAATQKPRATSSSSRNNTTSNNVPQPVTQQVKIQDARLVQQVQPRYPAQARRARRQGWVDVEYTVGTDGSVSAAHVVASRPGHLFDRAAVDAVLRWKYQPALRNGQPMAVTMRRRINFNLGGG
jgi:periplasmic protein TonB